MAIAQEGQTFYNPGQLLSKYVEVQEKYDIGEFECVLFINEFNVIPFYLFTALIKGLPAHLYQVQVVQDEGVKFIARMITEPKKSNEEILNLKNSWIGDGIWDIERTEGFEAHYGELLEFRLIRQTECVENDVRKIDNAAEKLHCSREVASAIININKSIEKINADIEKLHFSSI